MVKLEKKFIEVIFMKFGLKMNIKACKQLYVKKNNYVKRQRVYYLMQRHLVILIVGMELICKMISQRGQGGLIKQRLRFIYQMACKK